jgi:hypothetical protein
MKSNEALPCVKPNVNCRKSSGLSKEPSRFRACAKPPTFAHTFAITSISSASPLQFCKTVSFKILAACFPPSIPWDIKSSVNYKLVSSVGDWKGKYLQAGHLHQSIPLYKDFDSSKFSGRPSGSFIHPTFIDSTSALDCPTITFAILTCCCRSLLDFVASTRSSCASSRSFRNRAFSSVRLLWILSQYNSKS